MSYSASGFVQPQQFLMTFIKDEALTVVTQIVQYVAKHGYNNYEHLFHLQADPEVIKKITQEATESTTPEQSELEIFKQRYHSWLKLSGVKGLSKTWLAKHATETGVRKHPVRELHPDKSFITAYDFVILALCAEHCTLFDSLIISKGTLARLYQASRVIYCLNGVNIYFRTKRH
jgi:hypothetical protein